MEHNINDFENLNTYDRVIRIALAALLIGLVMFHPGDTLGGLAVLALVSVYPVFAAITGFDPLRALLTRIITAAEHAHPRDGLHRHYSHRPVNANQG